MISVVILTKNEEDNISDCIKCISWCDEVIVIDDYSEDKTVEIAKKLNAKIFKHSMDNDFSMQRNFGLSKAKGNWVLFVDADERISDALAFEISNIANQITDQILGKYSGFYIRRNDFMWGRKLMQGEAGGIKLLRLAEKNFGKWEGRVHEKWKVKGRIGELKNPIIHYPHKTFQEFLKEINFYTTIRANELHREGRNANFLSVLVYPLGKFILNYFLRRGFLDGVPGLIVATTMSFHSFLVRGKLWLIDSKDE